MAYMDDITKAIEADFTKAQWSTGQRAAGAKRQSQADVGLAARRGGYAGRPVEALLKQQVVSVQDKNKEDALMQLGLAKDKSMVEAKAQQDIANQQMLQSILGGAGAVFGTLVTPGVGTMIGSQIGDVIGGSLPLDLDVQFGLYEPEYN